MFAKLKELLQEAPSEAPLSKLDKDLAAAALLVEVAIIDNEFDGSELAEMKRVLKDLLDIADEDIQALIINAQNATRDATSVYEFTQLINRQLSPDDKFDLVVGMWRIAYADGNLDKYEEYIIRKVSDLIYVPHTEFIRAKLTAQTP